MSISEQIQLEIASLPPVQQKRVLDFIQALHQELENEDKAIGEASVKIMGRTMDPDDFSEWESKH